MGEREEVHKLCAELFRKVETAQGQAFVSDGESFSTKAQFFERIRGRLRWQREGVQVMEAFLRKHRELSRPPTSILMRTKRQERFRTAGPAIRGEIPDDP